MAVNSYQPILGTPRTILIDIDGTVALRGDRSPYNESKVGDDLPNLPVIMVVRAMVETGYLPVFMSGRTEGCRQETIAWINQHVIGLNPEAKLWNLTELHMRKVGDRRDDAIVKSELFDQHVRHRFNVVAVFDDRNRVVAMWRQLGLTVFQVAPGDF